MEHCTKGKELPALVSHHLQYLNNKTIEFRE